MKRRESQRSSITLAQLLSLKIISLGMTPISGEMLSDCQGHSWSSPKVLGHSLSFFAKRPRNRLYGASMWVYLRIWP